MYRIYMSDSLYLQGEGKRYQDRYIDIIKPKKIDNRSAEEIVDDVLIKAGITVVKGERNGLT